MYVGVLVRNATIVRGGNNKYNYMGAVFNLSYYTITTVHSYGIQIQWPMMMSFLMMSFLMMSFMMMSFMMMVSFRNTLTE